MELFSRRCTAPLKMVRVLSIILVYKGLFRPVRTLQSVLFSHLKNADSTKEAFNGCDSSYKAWTAACAVTTTWHKVGDFCFTTTAPSQQMSWQAAKDECVKTGGTLAVVNTGAAHKALEAFRSSLPNSGDPMWIGLKAENGKWMWAEGGFTVRPDDFFTKWPSAVPPAEVKDGNCVAVAEDHGSGLVWKEMPCIFPLKFICSSTAGPLFQSVKPGVAVTSTWIKKYSQFKYIKEQSKDGIYDVTSVLFCATIASTKNPACIFFSYSNSSHHCVLLNGVSAIQRIDMVQEREWDLWEKESVPKSCP